MLGLSNHPSSFLAGSFIAPALCSGSGLQTVPSCLVSIFATVLFAPRWMGHPVRVAFGGGSTIPEVNLGNLVLLVVGSGWPCSVVAGVLFPSRLIVRFDSYDLFVPLPFAIECS